jgi:phage terminase large subunit-like protein
LQAQEWAGFEIVEVTQSPAMISQPMKELEALIASGLVKHSGNRVLRWMMANVVQKHTKAGPVKFYFPTRASDALKIDGAVSLIMGLDGILRGAAPEPAPGMIMLG